MGEDNACGYDVSLLGHHCEIVILFLASASTGLASEGLGHVCHTAINYCIFHLSQPLHAVNPYDYEMSEHIA